ncbi:ATP-dependent DNA helicase [Trichonephila clavipes]|nr:ATP-dependent DNA helicase [Trichonephila clavipes]
MYIQDRFGSYRSIELTKTDWNCTSLHAEIVEVEIEVVSPSIAPSGNFAELNRTVTCMVLKANDRRTSCPCHDEFRGLDLTTSDRTTYRSLSGCDAETLIHSIYDDLHDLNIKEDSWLCERSILATISDQVSVLNQRMLDKIPGESQTYLSINTFCNPDEAVSYPTEFLNSISVPCLPPHKL